MTSRTAEHVEECDIIIQSILSKSKCRNCGRKMEMSVFLDLDSERPLQISLVCLPCSNLELSAGRQDLSMAVPGMSRAERLDSILSITNSLTDYARTSHKLSALNDLLQIVAVERIRLSYLDLASTSRVRGVYFDHDGVSFIMLDEALKTNPIEHLEVLAEEIGRYYAHKTASINHDDAVSPEIFALRWAVHYLSSAPDGIDCAS